MPAGTSMDGLQKPSRSWRLGIGLIRQPLTSLRSSKRGHPGRALVRPSRLHNGHLARTCLSCSANLPARADAARRSGTALARCGVAPWLQVGVPLVEVAVLVGQPIKPGHSAIRFGTRHGQSGNSARRLPSGVCPAGDSRRTTESGRSELTWDGISASTSVSGRRLTC